MEAARTFAARNPGQPLSVVFFNSQADGRAAADDGPQADQRGARKAAEARRGDAHLRRARRGGRPGARLGARRGAHRAALRRRRRRQHHEPRLGARPARRAEDPRVHGRNRVARLHAGRPPEDRGRDRRHLRRRDVAGGADEDLRRARLPARQRVPAPLPVDRAARTRTSTSRSPSRASSRCPSRTRARRPGPRRRTSRRSATGSPVVAPDPARRRPRPRARGLHDPLALEPPLEQGARRAPRRVRHAAGRGAGSASGARRSTRSSPLPAEQKQKKRRASAGWKASRRTSTSRRSSTTRGRMVWALRARAACSSRCIAGVAVGPFWVVLADRSARSA